MLNACEWPLLALLGHSAEVCLHVVNGGLERAGELRLLTHNRPSAINGSTASIRSQWAGTGAAVDGGEREYRFSHLDLFVPIARAAPCFDTELHRCAPCGNQVGVEQIAGCADDRLLS